MPDIDTDLHVKMLKAYMRDALFMNDAIKRGYATRDDMIKAVRSGKLPHQVVENGRTLIKIADLEQVFGKPRSAIYGMQWGDPDTVPPLLYVKQTYVLPYVKPEHVGLEIGPGGGRWTQYLLPMKKLYVVDHYQELLDALQRQINAPNLVSILNSGTDFPGVGDEEIDFLFSFGVFVHLDPHVIESYLKNMWRILKPEGVAFIQYSDKTKIMARINNSFVDTTTESMRKMVRAAGYEIILEDNTTIWHSNVVMFRRGSR